MPTTPAILRIPTSTVYTVTAENVELTRAEYTDISADSIARLLAGHFNLLTEATQPMDETCGNETAPE